MKAYLRMYRWAMQMKLHMAMYTFVAIFLKAVTNLLQGMKQMDIMELLSMWGVCLAFAMIESAIFPEGRPCTKGAPLYGWSSPTYASSAAPCCLDGFAGSPGGGLWR